MTDQDDIKAVLEQWLASLDNGDLQGMLDTCDAEVILANQGTPTTVGIDHVTAKYEPRIENSTFKSGFDIEHIAVFGDLAIVMGHFDVEITDKKSRETRDGSGRLALVYRRHADGAWKMILDMDNNA